MIREHSQRAMGAISTERVVELARMFCTLPSPRGEEGPIAEAIADILDRAGAEVHIEDVVAGRPNVVATVEGSDSRRPLVLNGHIDASVYPTGWRSDPHNPWVEESRLYGGGISDMKGAVAAMVAAVEAAAMMDEPLAGDLILHAVMHHDTIGLGAKYVLASEGPHDGYGVCGEPSNLAIHTANGGAIKFEIQLQGKGAHVSRQSEGADTLDPAVNIYQHLKSADFSHEPHDRLPDLPILHIGQMSAGVGPAVVADTATLRGDLRTVPGMNRRDVSARLKEIAQQAVPPDIDVKVRLLAVQRPFLGATDGPLVDTLSKAHESIMGSATKVTSSLPGQAFVTDAADMAAAGLDTVVYGVGDWHFAPNESVDIDELADSARVYMALALSLSE